MAQPSTEKKQDEEGFDLIQWRKSEVLRLVTMGKTEREIAATLQVSPSTVHRDKIELRAEARKELQEHIEGLPHAWQVAHTSINLLIRKAWNMSERKGLEFDQELDLIKTLADLGEKRLEMFTDPSVIDSTVAQKEAMKKEIERVNKKVSRPAPNDVEVIHETGTTNIERKGIKKGKNEPFIPVV